MAEKRRSSTSIDHHHHHQNNSSASSSGGGGGGGGGGIRYDDPPNSRLFIVCGRNVHEDEFREAFERFGSIEEIWVVKDRHTGEPKGVTYVKFSKTSEAALAMEEMNGRCIGSNPRPLKVLIAHSRDQGSRRESNEEERLLRLFVVVPRTMSEVELRKHFEQFGDVDYVSIVKDRSTKESKGFAYVKYHRMSHAAKAFEGCDRTFKAVFADPKPQKPGGLDGERLLTAPGIPPDSLGNSSEPSARLHVIASPGLNQDQLWRLFDIVPGMDYCVQRPDYQNCGLATVVYNSQAAAAYAKEKLHGFEYPPGQRLIVKFDNSQLNGNGETMNSARAIHSNGMPPPHAALASLPPAMRNGSSSHSSSTSGHSSMASTPRNAGAHIHNNLATLAETLAHATSLIQAAGLTQMHGAPSAMAMEGGNFPPSMCSASLPPPQPFAPVDAEVAERLFIVCQPTPPPIHVLKDIFGRFGSLIDVYMLGGKNCGYAKYASKESAEQAISTLHGHELCGSRLKVMPAEPHDKSDAGRKRIRMDDQQ